MRPAEGGAPVVGEVRWAGDDQYDVAYAVAREGPYDIDVALNGEKLPGSPFRMACTSLPADAGRCRVSGPGLDGASVGELGRIDVEAFDRTGNAATSGGDRFGMRLVPRTGTSDGARIELRQLPNTNKFSGSYSASTAGDHQLSVVLIDRGSEQQLPRSPFDVLISGPDARASRSQGSGLEQPVGEKDCYFLVEVRDSRGRPSADSVLFCLRDRRYLGDMPTATPHYFFSPQSTVHADDGRRGTVPI